MQNEIEENFFFDGGDMYIYLNIKQPSRDGILRYSGGLINRRLLTYGKESRNAFCLRNWGIIVFSCILGSSRSIAGGFYITMLEAYFP